MTKILNFKKIFFFIYSALFFITPLIMTSNTSELFEFNKIIFIYLSTSLVIFFWILKMIIFKKIIIKKTPFDIPIILFLVTQFLSVFFSIDKHTSIYGYYGRFNGGLLSIIAYILLFYGFVSNLSFEKKFLVGILKISLFSSLMVILWGLPGKFGYDLSCLLFMGQFNNSCWTDQFKPHERMFSTLGQPNWLGAYLTINFFIILYFIFKKSEKSLFSQFINFSISFLFFSSILFTRSRSALVAVLLGLIIFTYFQVFHSFKNSNYQKLKKLFLILTSVMLSIIFFKTGIEKVDKYLSISNFKYQVLHFKNKNQDDSKINNQQHRKKTTFSSDVTDSFDIRKIVWRGAVDLSLKYPFLGTGVETFAYSYYFVRPKEHNLTSEWDYLYNKAHNEYLNYLATTGFIGLGSYSIFVLVVILYALRKLKNKNKKEKIAIKNSKFNNNELVELFDNQLLIFCLLLAYFSILVTNFFGFSTTTINLFFYLIPAFFLIVSSSNELKKEDELVNYNVIQISLPKKISIIFLIFFTSYLIFNIFNYWYADTLYAEAEKLYKKGDYQLSVKKLTDALRFKYEHVFEDKLSYLLANLAVLAAYEKNKDLSEQLIALSQFYNHKSLKSSPKNVLYWKTRAKNAYIFFQINMKIDDLYQGIEALQKARELAPTDPKIPYSLAIFYTLLADEIREDSKKLEYQNLSLETINYATILKPNYRDGYFLKGLLLKKYKKIDEARKNFQLILNNINPQDLEAKKELESL